MARKNANSSPGVWLGLLLVLVAHTLALNVDPEKLLDPNGFPNNDYSDKDSTFLREVGPPSDPLDLDEISKIPNDMMKTMKDDAKDLYKRKLTSEKSSHVSAFSDESSASLLGNFEEVNVAETTTTVKSEVGAIPTRATIDFEQIQSRNPTVNRTADATLDEESPSKTGSDNGVTSTTTSHQEFELIEEHHVEEHANSELAEATTPSTKLSGVNRDKIVEDSHENIEHFDVEQSDAGNGDAVSLANDTNVNYKYLHNESRRVGENDTRILTSNNGVGIEHEPKHEVEVFKNVTHPAILRISEDTGSDMAAENTTPYYASTSKPKSRTISITGDNDLAANEQKSLNHSDAEHSTSDTVMNTFPKKSTSTAKPPELKPYPYLKSDSKLNDHVIVAENSNQTEDSTEEIAAYENTIGRKKSEDKIVVTEPSVLVENSIQQFKPVHNKRSGNSTRGNSTLDTTVTSTAWSVATTEELGSKNGTEVTAKSETIVSVDNGNRSQINNDVPQDNPGRSNTTERSPVILSEVTENNIETVIGKVNGTNNLTASTPISKKLTERSEVSAEETAGVTSKLAENSTENIETVSNGSSTSNEIQTENEESNIALDQSNGSTGEPLSQESFSNSTEINDPGASNTTEKLSLEVESVVSLPTTVPTITESAQVSSTDISTETKPVDESAADVTGLETVPVSRETTRSVAEAIVNQTTNVEYEFVELTTPGANSTVSQSDESSSEKTNTTSDLINETSPTTESEETVTTDGFFELNETTVSQKIETVDPETPALSTTVIFDTTTTSDTNSEITTNEDLSNSTNIPVSESSFTTETDVYTDTTLSSTSFDDNVSHERGDVTTSGISNDTEETTTIVTFTETVTPTEETTTISNIEVIGSSESTSTSQPPTTVTQSTTLRVQSTPELPEFPISSDDVTLFIRVIIEGSWSDVCPVLNNLRLSLANLLTEGTGSTVLPRNIILHQTQCSLEAIPSTTLTPIVLYVVDDNGAFDYTMTEILPSLYKASTFAFSPTIHSVEKLEQTEPSNNAIAVVAVSSVAFICLVILAGLLFIMRKRQTRFNYGERCRPVSLDAFRVDSVSAYNSVRRKGLTRASKRSYGNPAFEDSSVTPTHPLNFAGLSSFCNDSNAITEEFESIPQVTARMDELPAGSEIKNRYANVAPLPETRVLLQKINNEPLTEYINANYVRGPKNATKYYIACQAPMESTVSDFWRMIWEQQSKVIIMLTDIIENGVEKCVEYIPPSEVTDCHRLYGDYQVTLKKREAKEKYAISTLHLKNLENNTYREVSHIWYLWPTNGVPSNGTGLIAILLEARALQRGAPGPIVVHCSPGTGRTGTLIALDLGIRQYEITRTVDVPRVVYTIRRDRAGAVQTKEQYAFIYKALNLYAAKLAGGALESM